MCRFQAGFFFHLLVISYNNILVKTFDLQSIINDHSKYGVSCPNDYCQFSKIDSLESQACHCGMHCVQLGTCCLDSPYAEVPQPKWKPTCGYIHYKGFYYVVHKCPFIDSVWASECNDESIEDNDLQKLVPVTSLMTNITYKNFYCFRCYEAGDDFSYWTLRIELDSIPFRMSESASRDRSKHFSYFFDKKDNLVMASLCGGIAYFPVSSVRLDIPSEIKNLTHVCAEDVISDCSEEWSDEEIRNKCHSYMAIKEVERIGRPRIKYKNIHCALCNYENLNSVSCKKTLTSGFNGGYGGISVTTSSNSDTRAEGVAVPISGYFGSSDVAGEDKFSLETVFNINPSKYFYNKQADNNEKCSDDEQECSDIKKTCSDGEHMNPYTNTCKKLTCLMPGFKVKNDKCVKE